MATLKNKDRKYINQDNLSVPTYYFEPTIANGATVSDVIRLAGHNVIGIQFPTMDGAVLTAQVSFDENTWYDINGLSLTIIDGEAYNIASGTIRGWMFVRFVSDTSETAIRTLRVLIKES